jgi:hypothetical protein
MKSWFLVHGFRKGTLWTPFSTEKFSKPHETESLRRLFRDPVFHKTTVILMPLGPSVFKNIIFAMMIGYFPVLSAFRCAMFYMSFLSHLLKTPQ